MSFPPLERVDALFAHFSEQRVLVLGDLMLDRYLWGDTTRISPEAPVPVVEARTESTRLGGAANVADNVRALGATPLLVGIRGRDPFGHELAELLRERGISTEHLVTDETRRTTTKTRVLARNQQVLRVDREDTAEIGGSVLSAVLERARAALTEATAVILSDYGKGVITRALLDPLLEEARARNLPVSVDPKETHFFAYRGVATITPNQSEAGAAYGRRIRDLETLLAAGWYLREELEARSVLITRGDQGMTLFETGEAPLHFHAAAREVFDVTGAGDTVVSTIAVALAAGASLAEAAAISNHAAGVVVREVGTAVATLSELRAAIAAGTDAADPEVLIADANSTGPGQVNRAERGGEGFRGP